ncbi:MAG: TIGR02099 family protein, partial [Chromatiales bacterium]|nr:TIGR02099 family protein [Chromatiales bacterium]
MKSVLGKFWLACAGMVVLLAVLLSLLRVLLPYVDGWRAEAEVRLAAAFGQQVSIGRLAAEWRGLAPQLELQDLRLGDAENGVHFERAHLEMDIPRSVLHGTLYIRKLTVSGLHLTLIREADGAIQVAGMGNPVLLALGEHAGILLPARGRLLAENAEIHLIDLTVPGKTIDLLFADVDFELSSTARRHQITGELTPPAGFGTRLRFALDLDTSPEESWRAQLYVDGVALPLQAWLVDRLPGLQPAGIANASVWMDWTDGVLQRVDGVFTVRSLELASLSPRAADAAAPASLEVLEEELPDAAPEASSSEMPNPQISNSDALSPETVNLEASKLDVPAPVPKAYTAQAASGVFSWRSFDGGWRLDVGDLVLDHGSGAASPLRFALGTGQSGFAPGELVARMDALPIEEITRLLTLAEPADASKNVLAEALAAVRPRGVLRDIAVSFQRADESIASAASANAPSPHFRAQADFADVAGEPWHGIPGFSALAGKVYLDENGGTLDVKGGSGELDFANLFRAPLPLDRLQATLTWEREGEGWRVRLPAIDIANEDLALNAWGHIDLPGQGASPMVALFANYQVATVAPLARYLPTAIMTPGTVQWLDESIKDGNVPRGDFILHGALSDFPYDHGQGLFRVDFDLRGGLLEYDKHWPRIENIDARLTFAGRSMEIAAERATTLGAAIGPTRVTIADMTHQPMLTVDGRARGPVGDGLAFLRDTPLAARFGPYVEDVAASGNHLVALSLELPLSGDEEARVNGTVTFEDSALALGKGDIEIKHIKGALQFSDDGLRGDGLTVNLLGLPATLSVDMGGEGGAKRAQVEARGVIAAADVVRLAHLPAQWLSGASNWRARLAVPGLDEIRSDGMTLYIESTLEGLDIALPAPLAKSADRALPLRVSLPLPRSAAHPLTLSLGERTSDHSSGDSLSIALGFNDAEALERGELRLGGGEAMLPEARGLRVVGHISSFSVGEWQQALMSSADKTQTAASLPIALSAIDLTADRVDVFGRDFEEVQLAAQPNDTNWVFDISSRQMAGRVEVPLDAGGDSGKKSAPNPALNPAPPWRADLKYLYLAATPADAEPNADANINDDVSTADPRQLPAMRIDSKRFSYGETDFGALHLSAVPAAAGMHLEQLSLISAVMHVEARGDWVQVDEEQYSSFDIEFDTDDFGRALAGFGYADTIRGGKGRSTISARWRGAPTAFALARLQGSMSLAVTDGRLLEVEPGAGRIFGLISLQALPRRLTLDFSDFFGKGFGFDRITGSFVVHDGVATTNDLAMVGPAARIEARG